MPRSQPGVLRDLSELLWRERHLLDLLHFKLAVGRMLLRDGAGPWIGHAARETEVVLDQLVRAEIDRALVVARAGDQLALDGETTLEAVAMAAPVPWNALLAGHRVALLALVGDVEAVAEQHVVELHQTVCTARRALDRGGAEGGEEDGAGGADIGADLALRLLSLEAALATTERVLPPSLVDFLR